MSIIEKRFSLTLQPLARHRVFWLSNKRVRVSGALFWQRIPGISFKNLFNIEKSRLKIYIRPNSTFSIDSFGNLLIYFAILVFPRSFSAYLSIQNLLLEIKTYVDLP